MVILANEPMIVTIDQKTVVIVTYLIGRTVIMMRMQNARTLIARKRDNLPKLNIRMMFGN